MDLSTRVALSIFDKKQQNFTVKDLIAHVLTATRLHELQLRNWYKEFSLYYLIKL